MQKPSPGLHRRFCFHRVIRERGILHPFRFLLLDDCVEHCAICCGFKLLRFIVSFPVSCGKMCWATGQSTYTAPCACNAPPPTTACHSFSPLLAHLLPPLHATTHLASRKVQGRGTSCSLSSLKDRGQGVSWDSSSAHRGPLGQASLTGVGGSAWMDF